MTSEGRTKLLSRPRQRAREQLSPLYAREREAEHDRLGASDGAKPGSVALDSRRRARAEDPGLPERHIAPRSFGQDVRGWLARLVGQGRLRNRVRRPGGHRHCREVTAVPAASYFTKTHSGLRSGNAMRPMIAVAATSKGLLTFQRNRTTRLPSATSAVSQSPIAIFPTRTPAPKTLPLAAAEAPVMNPCTYGLVRYR